MKIYTKPVIEINALDNTDVITASGGIAINFTNNAANSNFTQSKGYNVVDNF